MASIDLFTTSNLLRYVSEWDPREPAHTKGGYMDGEIKIPNVEGKLRMEIQTFPAEDVNPLVAKLHPCLLHVVQIVKGKRCQELEPVPTYYHWKQVFEIENGKVYILNKTSQLDFEKDGCTPRKVPAKAEVTELKGNSIVLGRKKEELNLILLQPKQQSRAKPTEATITKVLADRLQTEYAEKIEIYEEFFKKKHAKNLKRVRLRVDFYNENGVHCGHSVSPQTIIDTGNKEIGSMDLYDATPLKSCAKGGRKIVMVSEYNLAKGVWPIFQVHDEFGNHMPFLDKFLDQPASNQISLKNQTIIFLTPPQPKLQEIESHLKNFSIKLLAKREGDGYTSNKEFTFKYIDHKFNGCPYCDFKVDTDEFVQIETGIERPKPGLKKRKINDKPLSIVKQPRRLTSDEQSTGSSKMSSDHGASPPHNNGYSFENFVNSPDSGIDTRFGGYISDGGYTSSEFEYTTTLTQHQLDNLGSLTENATFLVAEDSVPLSKAKETAAEQFQNGIQVMEQEKGEFASENDVRMALHGIDSKNIETFWGQDMINKTYDDDIENSLSIDQLFKMDVSESDFIPNTAINSAFNALNGQWRQDVSCVQELFSCPVPHCASKFLTKETAEQHMVRTHGLYDEPFGTSSQYSYEDTSTIQADSTSWVKNQMSCVLTRRIQKDSTGKNGLNEHIKLKETSEPEIKERACNTKQRTPRVRNTKLDQDPSFIEEVPLLTMIFMILLLVFKLIGESWIGLSNCALTVVCMASALIMVYLKNKM